MKQIINRLIFTALAAVVLLVAGCSKEPQTEGDTDGTYLSLSIDGVKAATSAKSTRATAVDEGAITDVWVLQFEMTAGSTTEGTLVAKSYIAAVADPAKIPFGFAKGDNMAVYLVANSGDDALFTSTAVGTTLATVKEQSVSATTTAGGNFPTETSANLPMVGQSGAMTFPAAAVPVTLTRVVSKIVLTIKNPLETGYPLLTISSVQLKNTPKAYRAQAIDVPSGFDGSENAKRSPEASADNFRNYTAVVGNVTAAGTTSTYYLAPNVRGISTNTDDRLKSDLTAPADQGNFCTYVEIVGTAKASATAPAVDVRYRLYLGANNTNNFNLEANTAYKVDIELTGINVNDARITIATDRFDLIEGSTDGDHSEDIGGFVQPPPVVGGYYYSDGSYSTTLEAGKTATGLIYWIDPADPQIYKVMALEESSTKLAWAESGRYIVSGARSDTDGKANSVAIKAAFDAKSAGANITETDFAAAFPAAAYCYNYTGRAKTDAPGSWHLPAKSELQYLWCAYNGVAPSSWTSTGVSSAAPADGAAQGLWNGRIKVDGITAGITNQLLLSSTEYLSSLSNAWTVNFSNGGYTGFVDKSGTDCYVRCVRDIAPPPPAVGDFKNGGIVYEVTDATNYKVLSLDQGSDLKWSALNTYVIDPDAQSDADGKVNSAAIKDYFAANTPTVGLDFSVAFPAADFCDKKNTGGVTGWYLPAKDELTALNMAYKDNKPAIDAGLGSNGGTAIPTSGGYFWSSTENRICTSEAWYVSLLYGTTNNYDKSSGRYVRCVRDL